MSERDELEKAIIAKKEQIEKLNSEIKDLRIQSYLLCDEKQWYTEEAETHEVSKRPKKMETFLIGRINWKEEFRDEAGGKSIWINRRAIVRVDGKWQ